jgi:hypothetical protein
MEVVTLSCIDSMTLMIVELTGDMRSIIQNDQTIHVPQDAFPEPAMEPSSVVVQTRASANYLTFSVNPKQRSPCHPLHGKKVVPWRNHVPS